MAPTYSGQPPSAPRSGSTLPPAPPHSPSPNQPLPPPPTQPPDVAPQPPAENTIEAQIAELTKKFKSGTSWFFWIAGLTVASSALILMGSERSFAFGLGVTRVIDAFAQPPREEYGNSVKIIAIIYDLVIIGVVILIGVLAHHRLGWAFIVGMILYVLDGLIYLLAMDIIGILVHVFVLYCFFSGYRALSKLKALEASLAPPPYMQAVPQDPRFFPPPR